MKKFLIMMSMAAALFSGVSCAEKKEDAKLSVGFQLYSVRANLARDFEGTLQKVKDMGFEGVEFFNLYYRHTPQEVRDICDSLGLKIFSNHVPYQAMMADLDRVIEENTILGVEYIAFPYLDEAYRPGVDAAKFKEVVSRMDEIGAKLKEAGFQLLYHNHDFEFAAMPDGTVGHDYIFSATHPENIQVELDVCWADFSGFNPAEMVEKYAGRIPVLHMKDYYLEGKLASDPYALIGREEGEKEGEATGKFEFRPLGEGVVDIPAIIDAAKKNGVKWLCVEQDEPVAGAADNFEGPGRSIEFLRKQGML